MRNLLLAVLLALGGCASDANIYGCCIGQSIEGDENAVSIFNVYNGADALPLATTHCAKHQKTAKFKRMKGLTAEFDCVTA